MGNNSRESSENLKWESLEHHREVSRLALFVQFFLIEQ